MKSNLILKKFSVNAIPGTMNQQELKTFFGGKIIYSEDNIYINNDSIKFSQVIGDYNNGYQYYDIDTIPYGWETEFNENLTDMKNNYQKIALYKQTSTEINNNTRWQITINASNILRDYLFFKIKEQRVFKVIKESEIYSYNINSAIYEYINKNIFSRYRLEKIDFYVNYYNLKDQSIYNDISLQYNPKFDESVYSRNNITNINISGYDPYNFDIVNILYNQSKPSDQYSFNYYFDLNFTKI